MSSRPPSSQSSPALRPLGSPPRFSSTAPAFLEPLEPGRIMSPLAGVRPVTVAPTLPPMVPTAWDNDREDPTAFQAPSFETIGKPIRLKFCQEWYEKVFGAAANSIPDILDANNWLPPDTPVKLKLPGKLRQKMGLEPMGSNHGSSTNSPRSVTSRTSTQDGGAGRKGRKGRRKSSELREVTEIVEKDERHWAAVQLQCMARCWKARVNVARKKRRTKAQVLIASCFRGYLTRTGRRALVKRMKTRQSEIALVIPQLSLEKMDPFEQELDLRYVHLGEETHQLAPMMHHLQSLLLLELLGNYIGSKGLLPLVRILQKQPNLKYLGLAWNGLGDDSSKSLVRILQSHPQLDHLDLRYNRIGDKGAIHLAKIIKGHNIQLLDLQDNAICDSGAVSLYQACGRRLQLRLDCNSVPKHRLIELEEMLQARREEEERQMKEAQERLRAGKRKTNRPTSQQSKISQSLGQSKPTTPLSKGSKESKPSSSQRRSSRPSLETLSERS